MSDIRQKYLDKLENGTDEEVAEEVYEEAYQGVSIFDDLEEMGRLDDKGWVLRQRVADFAKDLFLEQVRLNRRKE